MAFDVLICPNCHGHLQANISKGIAICPNCNTQINMVERICVDGIPGVETFLNNGEISIKNGKYEEANQAYKNALKLDPNNGEAYYGRYLCEMKFAEYYNFRDDYGNTGQLVEAEIKSKLLRDYLMPAMENSLEPVKSDLQVLVTDEIVIINSLIDSHKTQNKSGCYIATAIYGSYYAKEVIILRRFRDTTLNGNGLGRIFVKIYYKVSPQFVKYLSKNEMLTNFVRKKLDMLVCYIDRKVN